MKQNIKSKIISLEREAHMLKIIHNIRKNLLSCGAYSDKNMEMQDTNFEKLQVPEWERQIIHDSWMATKLLSHSLLKELDVLNKEVLKEYEGIKNNEQNNQFTKKVLCYKI